MSSADLKKATAYAIDRASQRKISSKTGEEKKDSRARSDAEKEEGQVLLLNKEDIRSLLAFHFDVQLSVEQTNSMFKDINVLLTRKQKNIKWTNPEDKKWASNPKNLEVFKEKIGDMVWVVSGFEAAKTSKFKKSNKGEDVAGIISKFIKTELGQDVGAREISSKIDLGHGERGIAASEFALIRAAEEAAEKFKLKSAEKSKLTSVIIAQRQKHKLHTKVNHRQVWDAGKGTFNKDFRFIISYQDRDMNADDAKRERAAFEGAVSDWDIIGTNTSTSTLEGFEEMFFYQISPKKRRKNVKTSRKPRKKIDESSSAAVTKEKENTVSKKFSVRRGLELGTLKRAGILRKSAKKGVGSAPIQLLAMINKKLPQTVRENMGAPGLINRSGVFASSVRIQDVNTTPQGHPSFGYTYAKNPYQVFEVGTGSAPWSNAQRDPRKLIDRSIREVAAELAIGRFYTRRL